MVAGSGTPCLPDIHNLVAEAMAADTPAKMPPLDQAIPSSLLALARRGVRPACLQIGCREGWRIAELPGTFPEPPLDSYGRGALPRLGATH